MSTSSVLQDTSKNISLFRVRNTRSKEKCLRFFGEPEGAKLAIHTGGSSTKLLRMLSSAAQAQNPLSSRHHHHHHIYPTAMSTSSSSSSLSSTLSPANNNNNLLSSALSNLSMTVEIPQQALNNNNNHNLHHSSSSLSLASSTGGGTPVVASSRAAAAATISSRAVVHPIPLFNSSTRKIEQIFGQSCPVDVPVKDIGKTSGVSLLLQSKLPLAYFLGFLLTLKRPELVVRFIGREIE